MKYSSHLSLRFFVKFFVCRCWKDFNRWLHELQDKTLEQIKEEYKFDEIKDAFDKGIIPSQLEYFFSGDSDTFVQACNFLSLKEDKNEFVSFLCSDIDQNTMTNNRVLIHVKTGDIFYNEFNTKENLYNLLFACLIDQNSLFQKEFLITTVLKNKLVATSLHFP